MAMSLSFYEIGMMFVLPLLDAAKGKFVKLRLLTIFTFAVVSAGANAKSSSTPEPSVANQSISAVDSLPYMAALPQMKIIAGSQGEATIAGLNRAYNELKNQGNLNPTVSEVVDLYSHKQDHAKTADPVTVCVVAIAAGVAVIGSALERVREKAWRKGYEQGQAAQKAWDKFNCDTTFGLIIENSKPRQQNASLGSGTAI